MCRAREAGNDGDGHSENERTRGRHHQNGDHADRVLRPGPRAAGNDEGRDQEDERVAVGEPHHRRPRALRRFDEADNAGIGTLRGWTRRDEIEGLADVGRSAYHGLAGRALHRQRFTRQRRLVEHGERTCERAVGRHDLALADHEPVTRYDQVDVDLLELAIAVAHRGARRPRQQRRHLAARVSLSEVFQILSARIHQCDDDGGKLFANYERRRHRKRGDDVETELAAPQPAHDFHQQRHQGRQRRDRPNQIRPLVPAFGAQVETQCVPRRRKANQERANGNVGLRCGHGRSGAGCSVRSIA